jgi:tRNA U34 2-thiouridine synthase MnmA/TrmU
MSKAKAIALYSGGLDSTLAILVAMKQGIEVTAITFLTHFGCDISDKSSCSKDPFAASQKFGFEVKLCHLADKFIEIVKSPKFGHGKNMNPCMDCRILMLKEAKELMLMRGADFIITGEVLGQRPMSQRRDTFPRIDREAGLIGYVVRPLCAKLLKPTVPEQSGLVDREQFCNFGGRSRKPQMALAKELGLTEYPPPAGGCLLTDPIYSYRLKELLEHEPAPLPDDINLLRTGRHFRVAEDCKIIVGRDEADNKMLEAFSGEKDIRLWVEGYGSPLTVIRGAGPERFVERAAALCSRYSNARDLPSVEVTVEQGGNSSTLNVVPAQKEIMDSCMIQPEEGAPRHAGAKR